MPLPETTRRHLLRALEASPDLLSRLVSDIPADAAEWELAEEGRFNVRQTVAHLADWEQVFSERLEAGLADEGSWVGNPESADREAEYDAQNPADAQVVFRERRSSLLHRLRELHGSDWERTISHPGHGRMTVEVQAVHILSHDGDHLGYLARLLPDA